MPRIKTLNYWNLGIAGYEAWKRDAPTAIAVDTETTGFTWYDRAFCATMAWEGSGGVQSHYFEITEEPDLSGPIREMLARTPTLIFHNAKFDLQKLIREGLLVRQDLSSRRIEDTEGIYHLIDPHSGKKLKELAQRILGEHTNEAEAIGAAKKALQKEYKKQTGKTLYSKDIGYHLLPRPVLYPYALKDAEFTYRLWITLRPFISARGLTELYAREMELVLVLLDIEAKGMRVDMPYVNDTIKELNGEILECEQTITEITGKKVWYPERQGQKTPEGCINPGSWQQVQAALAVRGLVVADTKNETLERVGDDLAQAILKLRGLKKLLGTYMLNIKREQQDGIIHPNFKPFRPKTGRTSSAAESGD